MSDRWVVDTTKGQKWTSIFSESIVSLANADEYTPNEFSQIYNCEAHEIRDFIIELVRHIEALQTENIALSEQNDLFADIIADIWEPKKANPFEGALMRGCQEGYYGLD